MKKQLCIAATIIMTLFLAACSGNDTDERTADRNRDNINPAKVNYDIPNHGGPAISTADVSDQELDRNVNRRNIRGTNVQDRNRIDTTIRIAEEAARKVSDLKEVKHANIIVINHNAYVAAKLTRSARGGLTDQLEDTISRTVKRVDRDVDNVYISDNQEFYDRMNRYEIDIREGRSGFFNEFRDTVRRVFPDGRQD